MFSSIQSWRRSCMNRGIVRTGNQLGIWSLRRSKRWVWSAWLHKAKGVRVTTVLKSFIVIRQKIDFQFIVGKMLDVKYWYVNIVGWLDCLTCNVCPSNNCCLKGFVGTFAALPRPNLNFFSSSQAFHSLLCSYLLHWVT